MLDITSSAGSRVKFDFGTRVEYFENTELIVQPVDNLRVVFRPTNKGFVQNKVLAPAVYLFSEITVNGAPMGSVSLLCETLNKEPFFYNINSGSGGGGGGNPTGGVLDEVTLVRESRNHIFDGLNWIPDEPSIVKNVSVQGITLVELFSNAVTVYDSMNNEQLSIEQQHLKTQTDPLVNPRQRQEFLHNRNKIGLTDKDKAPSLVITSATGNFGKSPLLFDEKIVGTGNSGYNNSRGRTEMTVNSNNDVVVRQTFQYHPYIAGKPMEFEFTFDNFQPQVNVMKRVGCFHSAGTSPYQSSLDGIFFSSYDDGLSGAMVALNIFNNGTQIVSLPQFSWLDPLDGNGASGITIDWSKFQKAKIEWIFLGGGAAAKFYLSVLNNEVIPEILIAVIPFSNIYTGTIVRWCCQPIRFEIRSSGGTGQFNMYCAGMSIQGSTNDLVYRPVAIRNGYTYGSYANVGTIYPALMVRIDPASKQKFIDFKSISVLSGSNDDVAIDLIRNPTIVGGTPTFTSVPNSGVQFATNNAGTLTVTAGTGNVVYSENLRQFTNFKDEVESALRLGTGIDDTPVVFALCLTPISAGLTAGTTINLLEIS